MMRSVVVSMCASSERCVLRSLEFWLLDNVELVVRFQWKASKTRRGEPAGPEYGLVPSFLPNIRELTRVEIPRGA